MFIIHKFHNHLHYIMSNGESSNEESVLFLSMGRSTQNFFLTTMKNHNPMPSQVYLIYESYVDNGSHTNNEWVREEWTKIRASRDKILEWSGNTELNEVNIDVLRIPNDKPETVRDALLPYLKKHAHAKISFNITSGTTMRIASLFALAMWLSSEIHYSPTPYDDIILPMPVLHLSSLNENQRKILKALGQGWNLESGGWKERKDLMKDAGYLESTHQNLTMYKEELTMFIDDLTPLIDMELIKEEGDSGRSYYRYLLTEPKGRYAAQYLRLEGK